MIRLLISVTFALLLASCDKQVSQQASTEGASVAAATPEQPLREQSSLPPPSLPTPPLNGTFQTPLPQGVVLSQPHYARMDVPVTNNNGSVGRRTEFEYLEGDAEQAMQAFATAMAAAGFESADGPTTQEGVVRQVFKKEGYGTVFVRSQQQPPSQNKHDSALGFVVVAWPGQRTLE